MPEFLATEIWKQGTDLLSIEQFYPVIRVAANPVSQQGRFSVYRSVYDNPGAGGYIVSKSFAQLLLQHSEPFYHLVDLFMFSARRVICSRFATYQVTPALCIQGRKNEEFGRHHHVYPTSMKKKNSVAALSPQQKKDFPYYYQRLITYLRLYKAFLLSKKKAIDFID